MSGMFCRGWQKILQTFEQGPNVRACLLARLRRYSRERASRGLDIIQFICTDLNNRNCFDFVYTKSEGDVLSVSITDAVDRSEKWFRFRVVGNVWIQDCSSSLDGWRRQMVLDKLGFVQ